MKIANRVISSKSKPFIIAELSGNHAQNFELAKQMVSAAASAGVDAIKLQTYTADSMTLNIDSDNFRIMEDDSLWHGQHLHELYQQASTPYEWHKPLFDFASELGLIAFSSPFDEAAVDFLESLNVPAYKIASFELTDIPLIQKVAKTGKPLIMSTGMANLEEIAQAVECAQLAGCQELVLLHCISAYPAPADESNLNTIPDLASKFKCIVGLSDHTIGTTVPMVATALGANVIEKHVTLSRADKGPDSEFSLEPAELKQLCEQTYHAWQTLGNAGYERKPAEQANARFRRSIYFVKDVPANTTINAEHIKRIRPGFGLSPKYFDDIIGMKTTCAIRRGEPVSWEKLTK